MQGTLHAFEYLAAAPDEVSPPVCVLFGDEDFLKRLVRQRLREAVLGESEDAPFTSFSGDAVEWRDVADEAATVSLFGGGKRFVLVEGADDFVSQNRTRLEDYLEKPRRSAVLVLEVETWASNTRLYKAVHGQFLQIDCRLPQHSVGRRMELDSNRLVRWLVDWTKSHHRAALTASGAQLLIDLVGPHLGMLDQDLAKLSLFVKPSEKITPELVQEVIGGWRAKTVWEMVDAAADGNAAEAIRQLELALQSGEHPQALYGQIAWSLRRFTVASRIFTAAEKKGRRITIREALEQAGFRPWPQQALANAERQIKQLGRQRAGKLLQWLLDADLALKGSHSAPDRARFVLEHLFLRMAQPPEAAGSAISRVKS